MALVGRSPIRISATPSHAPQEAMIASLQAHIDELVQKNRAAEHVQKRLQQSLQDEKERAIDAMNRLKSALQQEREEWQEGCDSLLASHRIVHLRTRNELDKEKLNVVREKEDNRKERIAVLHRDYKLTLFQAKEMELEARIADLEDALEEMEEDTHELAWQKEADAIEFDTRYAEATSLLSAKLQKANLRCEEVVSKVEALEAEHTSLQSELNSLRKEHASLKATSESSSTKLERTTLQLEGAKTSARELESKNKELLSANQDLKRQLEQWQTLENKSDAEVEDMRRRRIELEVEVKQLQDHVKELEKTVKEKEKTLDKELKRVDKLRKENDRMAEVTEEAQNIAKQAHSETDEAQSRLQEAYRLIEKLQSKELEGRNHNGKAKMPTQVHQRAIAMNGTDAESTPTSEKEVEAAVAPAAKPKRRGKAARKQQESDEDTSQEGPSSQPAKKSGRARAAYRTHAVSDVEEEHDENEESNEENEEKGRVRSESRRKKKEVVQQSDTEEVEEQHEQASQEEDDEPPPPVKKSRNKAAAKDDTGAATGKAKANRKNRANAPPSDGEEAQTMKPQPSKRKPASHTDYDSIPKPEKQKSRKPASKNAREKSPINYEEEVQQPKKKKKLFPSSQPLTFPWDDLPKGDNILNIPTDLSPVKDTKKVPARSVFGKVGSTLGW